LTRSVTPPAVTVATSLWWSWSVPVFVATSGSMIVFVKTPATLIGKAQVSTSTYSYGTVIVSLLGATALAAGITHNVPNLQPLFLPAQERRELSRISKLYGRERERAAVALAATFANGDDAEPSRAATVRRPASTSIADRLKAQLATAERK
jgi:hypothetical protein